MLDTQAILQCSVVVKNEGDSGELSYHEQGPNGVVDEDGGCCNEHAEAYETVKLNLN